MNHQVWRLRTRHRELERMIREEQRRPVPDAAYIQSLKH